MKVLQTALLEIYGLFVEDSSYAVAIVIWIFVAAMALPHLDAARWRAPILFAGLVLILADNVVRSAKKR